MPKEQKGVQKNEPQKLFFCYHIVGGHDDILLFSDRYV